MDNTACRAREVKEGEDYLAVVNYFYLTEHCRFHIFVKRHGEFFFMKTYKVLIQLSVLSLRTERDF